MFHSDIRGPANPHGRNHLYLLALETGRITELTSGADWRDEDPRWSPDGLRIAFKSTRPLPGANGVQAAASGNYDIFVMDVDTRRIERITDHPANDHDPVWAPDGQSLVFSSERDGRGDLYRVWLSDRRVERLTRNVVGRAMMPALSPDGQTVAFAAQTLSRARFWLFQIHLLDLATGTTRTLEAPAGTCWPAWSPDGTRLAHVMLDEEPSSLMIVSATGEDRVPFLADPKLWSYYPEWSPDGAHMAFSVSPEHHEGEDWDLAVAPVRDGRTWTKLTEGPGNDRLPDWRP